jgi:GAF domain-containing protein
VLSAIRTATIVQVDDLGRDSRYPTFGPAAASLGVASCLSVPLRASGATVGSLNLYGEVPYAYDETAVATGEAVAALRLASRYHRPSPPARPRPGQHATASAGVAS